MFSFFLLSEKGQGFPNKKSVNSFFIKRMVMHVCYKGGRSQRVGGSSPPSAYALRQGILSTIILLSLLTQV